MKHRTRPHEQDDLLRPRMVDLIDLRHELVNLTSLIDWVVFVGWSSGFMVHAAVRSLAPEMECKNLRAQC